MKRNIAQILLLAGLSLTCVNYSFAQQARENNQKEFGEFIDRKGTFTRTASGNPGAEYWQNAADYQIEATLDDVAHILTGKVTLTYTNNSPEKLEFIWMQL